MPTLRNSSSDSDSIISLDLAETDDDGRLTDKLEDLSIGGLASEIGIENLSSVHEKSSYDWDVSDLFEHFDCNGCGCWKCKAKTSLKYVPRRFKNKNTIERTRTLKSVPIDNFTAKSDGMCNFVVINCRSLFPKILGLVESNVNLCWDIAILSETWQSSEKYKVKVQNEILDNLSNMHGLDYIGEPRKRKEGVHMLLPSHHPPIPKTKKRQTLCV